MMVEIKVDTSEFKGEGSDVIKELTDMLQEKTKAEVKTTSNSIEIKGEEKTLTKAYVRVLLRKFLHKKELKKYFRVLIEKENVLRLKAIKGAEEEED
jgi:hypothetical protein